jgi:RNA polymerase sigma factor (TIGR02999 family)
MIGYEKLFGGFEMGVDAGPRLTDALNRPATSAASRWRGIGPLIDRELNHIAGRLLRQFVFLGWTQTLESGELVGEFYLRVLQEDAKRWVDRKHFFAYAAACMRNILTDRHRARHAAKRTCPDPKTAGAASDGGILQRIDIQMALEKLEHMSPRQAGIVEMRFFRGMEIPEIARSIQMSEKTVQREWLAARAWLYSELKGRCLET